MPFQFLGLGGMECECMIGFWKFGSIYRVMMLPCKVAQFVPQLTYVVSCEWQTGDKHLSIAYNSPYERVIAQIMPLYVVPA